MLAVEQLRQRNVVSGLRLRTGVHRDAEACATRRDAVDGDEEGAVTPGGIVAVNVAAAHEHPILDVDGVQFTGPHPDECHRLVLYRLLLDDHVSLFRAT